MMLVFYSRLSLIAMYDKIHVTWLSWHVILSIYSMISYTALLMCSRAGVYKCSNLLVILHVELDLLLNQYAVMA